QTPQHGIQTPHHCIQTPHHCIQTPQHCVQTSKRCVQTPSQGPGFSYSTFQRGLYRLSAMSAAFHALSAIYNFRAISDKLGTAGQPTEAQFKLVRDAGFAAVINLALPTSDNALPNEGS